MEKRPLFIRNFEAWDHFEIFLVSSVSAILIIRLYLRLAGYPQLGGENLHVAHVLWGGFLMLASMAILLSFLSRATDRLAAVVGGVGFGTFVDEIGKFVTADNDYFFQPAVALMYVSFVLTFLLIHRIHFSQGYTHKEFLMNALQEMEEVVLHEMDEQERNRTLKFLERSDPRHPLVAILKAVLGEVELVPVAPPGFFLRCKRLAASMYSGLANLRWFSSAVVLFFIGQLLLKTLLAALLIFFVGYGWQNPSAPGYLLDYLANRLQNLHLVDWLQLASSLLSALFVLVGVLRIRRSRLAAFRMFESSILVSIFLTQVFAFYRQEFAALLGLFFNMAILAALRYMIDRERLESGHITSSVPA